MLLPWPRATSIASRHGRGPSGRPPARLPEFAAPAACARPARLVDQRRDAQETEPSRQERRHRDFVRRVQHRRRRAARLRPPPAPAPAPGNRSRSGASKSSRAAATRSSDSTPERDSLRPAERVRDRGAHVRVAELRQDRPVHVLHHRMHDALRMYDHLDLRAVPCRTARRPRSARGPCSSASPNRPRSCGPCASADARRPARASPRAICSRACAQERAAGGREQDAAHARAACARAQRRRQALEDRVVLAVDRHERRAARARPHRRSSAPASDQRLPCSRAARACRRVPPRASTAAPPRRRWPPSRCRLRCCARDVPRARRSPHSTSVAQPALAQRQRRAARGRLRSCSTATRGRCARHCSSRPLVVASRRERDDREAVGMTLRAHRACCTPMLPVLPSTATRFMAREPQHVQPEQERRRGRRQAVDAIEHAAVARQQVAAVLEPDVALEHALGEVADHRDQRDELAQSTSQRPQRHRRTAPRRRRRRPPRRSMPADEPFPGLARAHVRRELAPPERAAAEIGTDVGRGDQHEQEQQQHHGRAAAISTRCASADAGRHQHEEPDDSGRAALPPRRGAHASQTNASEPPDARSTQQHRSSRAATRASSAPEHRKRGTDGDDVGDALDASTCSRRTPPTPRPPRGTRTRSRGSATAGWQPAPARRRPPPPSSDAR